MHQYRSEHKPSSSLKTEAGRNQQSCKWATGLSHEKLNDEWINPTVNAVDEPLGGPGFNFAPVVARRHRDHSGYFMKSTEVQRDLGKECEGSKLRPSSMPMQGLAKQQP